MKPWPFPLWIAHRGAGKLAPENTLAAFRLGAAHGYRAFECDVKLSADGVPFLLHDDTLERTSNGQGIAGEQPWAVISQLDLVVTVDTAVAHVAGAMAKPVWLMLQHNADFRWLHNRSDSPWYEMVRLFRQPEINDWVGAIDDVVDALGEVLGLDLERLAKVED